LLNREGIAKSKKLITLSQRRRQMERGKILIIEDEAGFRKIYKDFLQNEGYDVLEADNAEKGFILIKSAKPDLVLLDLVLPNISGFDVLKKLRSEIETKDLPIIIFSVIGERDTIKKGLELGANDYAIKGFYSPGEMLSKIQALLFKADMKKHMVVYKIEVNPGRADAARLTQDMGMGSLQECPHCKGKLCLELIPDFSRSDGHWFFSHFVCQECKVTY
jgi:DNA-binding response OmpR family regulator